MSTGTISLKALLASSLGPCSDPGLTIQDVAIRVAVVPIGALAP